VGEPLKRRVGRLVDSMGQYFVFVNPVKKQFLDAGKFDEGVKYGSVLVGNHAYAIALLVCKLDEVEHSYGELAGYWFGDPVIVAGDDEGPPNAYGIRTATAQNPDRNLYWMASEEFEDISYRAVAMLCEGRKGFAKEIVDRALNGLNPEASIFELGNVVSHVGCAPLKEALIEGYGENWIEKYIAAVKEYDLDGA